MLPWKAALLSMALTSSGFAIASGPKPPTEDAKSKQAAPTHAIMQAIFSPMSAVLALSFDRQAFSEPQNRRLIQLELSKLVDNSHLLEEHGKVKDRSFEYAAKSLARDARRLQHQYDKGRYDQARFTLHNMTDNCLMCHANLPETRKFPAAKKFFEKIDVESLRPLDRAHVQIVSRQFDDALETYETLFRTKDLDPAIITQLGSFSEYLKIAISVKSDFERPQATIEYQLGRSVTPLHIKQQLQRWFFTLKKFDAQNILAKTDFATARTVLNEGRNLMEFPRDRDGLVHYLTAEAMLTRYVHNAAPDDPNLGEAYYLLGMVSSLTEHSIWITRSDFYLESAIRMAPASSFAPKAYALLEESLIVGFTGSGGTHVPSDVKALLDELRAILQKEHSKI